MGTLSIIAFIIAAVIVGIVIYFLYKAYKIGKVFDNNEQIPMNKELQKFNKDFEKENKELKEFLVLEEIEERFIRLLKLFPVARNRFNNHFTGYYTNCVVKMTNNLQEEKGSSLLEGGIDYVPLKIKVGERRMWVHSLSLKRRDMSEMSYMDRKVIGELNKAFQNLVKEKCVIGTVPNDNQITQSITEIARNGVVYLNIFFVSRYSQIETIKKKISNDNSNN